MIKNEKKLLMMVGVPGTGKSTWIDNFKKSSKENVSLISSDNIIEMYAKQDNLSYDEAFKRYSKNAMSDLQDVINQIVSRKDSLVIWDQTNLTVKARRRKLSQFQDYKKIAVVFELTDKELNKRVLNRKQLTGKVIPTKVVNEMKHIFVRPTLQEGFDEIILVKD